MTDHTETVRIARAVMQEPHADAARRYLALPQGGKPSLETFLFTAAVWQERDAGEEIREEMRIYRNTVQTEGMKIEHEGLARDIAQEIEKTGFAYELQWSQSQFVFTLPNPNVPGGVGASGSSNSVGPHEALIGKIVVNFGYGHRTGQYNYLFIGTPRMAGSRGKYGSGERTVTKFASLVKAIKEQLVMPTVNDTTSAQLNHEMKQLRTDIGTTEGRISSLSQRSVYSGLVGVEHPGLVAIRYLRDNLDKEALPEVLKEAVEKLNHYEAQLVRMRAKHAELKGKLDALTPVSAGSVAVVDNG